MTLNKKPEDPESIRSMVSAHYARIAEESDAAVVSGKCCCGSAPGADDTAVQIGYGRDELSSLPEGANLGLGCGNPTAIDSLTPGEVVVDLGSGAGIDCFLAARKVGSMGRVIGVDMTDAMLEKARRNARVGGYTNVEFRKGRIEQLPIEDESVDAIISNCVINLSPQKDQVFREAFRVLKPGGRMMISDIVLDKELPPRVLASQEAWAGCLAGANLRSVYLQTIRDAGFSEIRVVGEAAFGKGAPIDDPASLAVLNDSGLSIEDARDVLGAATSLQILVRK